MTDRQPRTALVAGGSRGLGLLIAAELARKGIDTTICSRDADELDRASAQLAAQGLAVTSRTCDVSDRGAVRELIATIERERAPLDVVIHVAGVIQVGPLEAQTPERFDEAIASMLTGPINVMLAVVPGMRERRFGRLGVVTSIGGVVSVPHLLPYSTAKFGAVGFSQGLAAELAGTGVTVTTIVPGLMRTGSHLHAQFTGEAGAEYAWFAPGASLPVVSMSAEIAAARIVAAVLAGRTRLTLTPLAHVGAKVAGVAPALTTRVMGVAARLLPRGSQERVREGMTARDDLGGRARRIVDVLATLGDRAARRTNETKPSPHVPTQGTGNKEEDR